MAASIVPPGTLALRHPAAHPVAHLGAARGVGNDRRRRRSRCGREGGGRCRLRVRRGDRSRGAPPQRLHGAHVDHVVRPDRDARVPRREHHERPPGVERLHRGVSPSARVGEGVLDARPSVGRQSDPRRRGRARGIRVRRARCRLRHRGARTNEAIEAIRARVRKRVLVVRRRVLLATRTSGSHRGPSTAPSRSGSAARASPRYAALLSAATAGSPRAPHARRCRSASTTSGSTATRCGPTPPSTSGSWRSTSTSASRAGTPAAPRSPALPNASPHRSSTVRDLGCNVLYLHFRSRDRHELVDQLAAFGRDVAPLLNP